MSFADRTAELWLEIDQLHLRYLQHEDTVAKIDLRKKLERSVKEYLSLVPQDRKFVSASTGDIITNSVRWITEFSLTKAAEAFQCIEQYAANLISQPWRTEYRTIRQFNGFYMHNIKSVLSGAEKLFFDMGYARDDSNPEILKLKTGRSGEPAVNLDAVTQVARDCLLARMEAIILQEIFTGVVPQYPIGLEELVEFRRDHIGTPEDAIRELMYRRNQSRFQFPGTQPFNGLQQNYAPFMAPLPGFNGFTSPNNPFPATSPLFPGGPGAFNPGSISAFSNPYQTGFMAAQYPGVHLQNPQMNGGLQAVPAFLPNGTPLNGTHGNGSMMPHGVPVSSVPAGLMCSVPGSLGSQGTGLGSPAGSSTSTLRQGQIPTTILDLTGDDTRMVEGGGARPRDKSERGVKPRYNETKTDRSRPVKERGRGSRGSRSGEQGDSWDYVYKELEQQGYSKDQAERPDILANNRQSYLGGEELLTSDEDIRRNFNQLQLRDTDTRDMTRGGGGGGEGEGRGRDKSRTRNSREYIPRELTSESEQDVSRYSSANSKNTENNYRSQVQERPQRTNRGNNQQSQGAQRPRKLESDEWECGACTFHNPTSVNICEMCSKTKDKSYKTTLMDGIDKRVTEDGAKSIQCGRCTLLNPPNTKVCEACGASLGLTPPV